MIQQSNVIRVLIADDNAIVRQGLAALLEQEPDLTVVAKASNGQEALTMFRQYQPDVTLMEVRMSQMDGVEAIAALCTEFEAARIVAFTVICLIAVGKCNQEISSALHISQSTVKFHVNNILSKMGANDRTQAAIFALKRGIVSL
ncbi:MAG: response regulator transcription factor [Richelia sp. CSU_2_1]|nr:response regulator transcription factor [Richelia sp. CSU_2_1]